MQSTLSWIDQDAKSRDRALRILAQFQEKDSRDELGLGSIRDSFSDLLFPGTSTIQTRLRYMLIVPWMFRELERKKISTDAFARAADTFERDLIKPLLDSDDNSGVFGRTSGQAVKRLPSSVYWGGLAVWGIRLTPYSVDQYFRHIDEFYRSQKREKANFKVASTQGDDIDSDSVPAGNWHSGLPEPPSSFPENLDLNLTQEEALYLKERLLGSRGESLFAHLVQHCKTVECTHPWEHPELESFTSEHQEQLYHAKLFSVVLRGAALTYNIELSKLKGAEERVDQHTRAYAEWAEHLPIEDIENWKLQRLWEIVSSQGHTITRTSKSFVTQWVSLVKRDASSLIQDKEALELIKQREMRLKGNQSRYRNKRVLDQWGGNSGTQTPNYRWVVASRFMRDLHDGLNR